MSANPPFLVGFSFTVTSTAAALSLYSILSGQTVAGITLGAALNYTPTGKVIASVTIQNDPANGAGALVYLGDPTLSTTNKGLTLAVGQSETFSPSRGSNAWANGIYLLTSATSVVINVMVLYG